MSQSLAEMIQARKKELDAVILAHFYQRPEIQEIADFVGDSLQLAQQATRVTASTIVFCGVGFMAESAKILNPEKRVILPVLEAGCPMADMITAEQLRKWKAEHPGSTVVCYVNSSAEVKAESDLCCTSANAVRVVESIPPDQQILFVPDQNLGDFVAKKTGRKIIAWEGYCPTHHYVTPTLIHQVKKQYPDAVVVVHPECRPDVVAIADAALSTGGMIKYIGESPARTFIVGTEEGIMYQLHKRYPDRKFILAHEEMICPNMKLTTIADLARAMETLEHEIDVDEEIRVRATRALEAMLRIG